MAGRGNLDLALRIQTDLKGAVSEVRGFKQEIADTGAEAKRTSRALAGVDASGMEKAGKAGQAAAQGARAAGESATAAASRIRDMVQASLDHQRALQAQMTTQQSATAAQRGATNATAAQADAMRQANQAAYASQAVITAQIKSISELHERLERGASSTEDLADTEQLLDRAMAAGLVSMEEQTEILAELDQQEKRLIATHQKETKAVNDLVKTYDPASAALKKLEQDEARLKKAVDAGVISREQYNRAMAGVGQSRAEWLKVNEAVERTGKNLDGVKRRAGDVRRSLTTAATNLATGNILGAGDALVRVGVTGASSMTLLAGAVTGVVAVLAGYAFAALRGYQEGQQLNRVMAAGGEAAGVTESAFYSMSVGIDHSVDRIGKGREALLLLIGTGRATAETLEAAGQAAVAMSELTGRSIQDTTRDVQQLLQEPGRYAAELNRQYHFLTASQYERIRALEAEGRATEAARLAVEAFGATANERLGSVQERVGLLEKAWRGLSNTVGGAWESLKSIGRDQSAGERIANLTQELEGYERVINSITGESLAEGLNNPRIDQGWKMRIRRIQEELSGLREVAGAEQEAAEEAAARQRIQDAGVNAQEALGQQIIQADRLLAKKRDELALEQKIAALRAAGIANLEGMPLDQAAAKLRADIEKRYEDPDAKKSKEEAERAAKALAEWVAQLEHQAAVLGLTREQTLQYEIAERQLTGALKERALAAAEALGQAEEDEAIKRDAELLAQVQVQYLRAIGKASEAAELELEQRYGELLGRLKARGDAAGVELINSTINLEQARVRLAELQAEVERVQTDIARREQQINAEQDAGLISSVEARKRIVELRQKELEQLGALIPLLREAAIAAGDEQALARIDDMTARLELLKIQASELMIALRNGVEQGLATALEGLATNTLTLRDAFTGLIRDIARGMAQVASQQLAALATAKLMSVFGKGGNTPDLQAPDPAEAAAAGTAYAAPIGAAGALLSSSAAIWATVAGQIQAAAVALAAAGGASGGGGASSGNNYGAYLQAAMSLFAGGFAEGGLLQGPGTGTSDSMLIRASTGEYVVREAAVRRYGVGVLEALNNMQLTGMPMLAPTPLPAPKYHFAEGGMVQGPAAGQPITIRPVVAIGERELAEAMNSADGDRVFLTQARRLKSALREVLR